MHVDNSQTKCSHKMNSFIIIEVITLRSCSSNKRSPKCFGKQTSNFSVAQVADDTTHCDVKPMNLMFKYASTLFGISV